VTSFGIIVNVITCLLCS